MNIIKDIENYKYPSLIPYKSMIKELLKLDNLKTNYGFGSLEFTYNGELNEIPLYWNDINFILDKYNFVNRSEQNYLDDQSKHYCYDDGDGYTDEDHELNFYYIHKIILEISSSDKIKIININFEINMDDSKKILYKYITDEYNSNKPN